MTTNNDSNKRFKNTPLITLVDSFLFVCVKTSLVLHTRATQVHRRCWCTFCFCFRRGLGAKATASCRPDGEMVEDLWEWLKTSFPLWHLLLLGSSHKSKQRQPRGLQWRKTQGSRGLPWPCQNAWRCQAASYILKLIVFFSHLVCVWPLSTNHHGRRDAGKTRNQPRCRAESPRQPNKYWLEPTKELMLRSPL